MPSALMSPWRKGYAAEMLKTYPRAVKSVLFFDEVSALPSNEKEYGETVVRRYESASSTRTVVFGDDSSDIAVRARAAADRVNRIAKVYQVLSPAAGFAALAFFAAVLILSIRGKRADHLPYLLVTAGMGLSVMAMLTGIVYTEITAFPAIRHTYLAGAYPLALACEAVTILYSAENIKPGGRFSGS